MSTQRDEGSLFSRIAELEAVGTGFVLVTVVRASGSTPRGPGAKMIVFADGTVEGTIGGGQIEARGIQAALETFTDGRPKYLDFQLTQSLGMCCGGSVGLFVEAVAPAPRLVIFGAGHVGAALAKMAVYAGFVVHVADEREALLSRERLPEARALHDDLDDPALPFGPNTYAMVTTHDHALDQAIVERLLTKPTRWLGLIGSRRKAALTRDRLRAKGVKETEVARLRCPVGLAIGAETPEEIAVAIVGELIASRRGSKLGIADSPPRLETKEPLGQGDD